MHNHLCLLKNSSGNKYGEEECGFTCDAVGQDHSEHVEQRVQRYQRVVVGVNDLSKFVPVLQIYKWIIHLTDSVSFAFLATSTPVFLPSHRPSTNVFKFTIHFVIQSISRVAIGFGTCMSPRRAGASLIDRAGFHKSAVCSTRVLFGGLNFKSSRFNIVHRQPPSFLIHVRRQLARERRFSLFGKERSTGDNEHSSFAARKHYIGSAYIPEEAYVAGAHERDYNIIFLITCQ